MEMIIIEDLRCRGVNEEKIKLIMELLRQMERDETPPNLRNVERNRVKEKVELVNEVLGYIITEDITATNRLLKAAGCVVGRLLLG